MRTTSGHLFCEVFLFIELKQYQPPITIEQQIENLKKLGLVINDEEERFKALLSKTRKTVEHEIKNGFANVPRGCLIQLEKQAQEYILANIRNAVNNKLNLIGKLVISWKSRENVERHFDIGPNSRLEFL
ncbi:MAG: hypothetical protein ACOYIB_08030 [Desulfosporosinus sp.]